MTLRSKKKKRNKQRKEKRFLKFNKHNKQLKLYCCSSKKIVHSLACPQQHGKKVASDSLGLVNFQASDFCFLVGGGGGKLKLQRILIKPANKNGFGG